MLPALRDQAGRPGLLVRVLAVLVALGMIAIAAPAIVPVVSWVLGALA